MVRARQPPEQFLLHSLAATRIFFAGPVDQSIPASVTSINRRKCYASKWNARHAVAERTDKNLVVTQVTKLFCRELLAKICGKNFRVIGANSKRNHCTHISENRGARFWRKLIDILVSERQTQAIFSGFGEARREAARGEIMKLIDEQVKVASVLLRQIRTGHRRVLKLRNEQGAEQIRRLFAEAALGEVGNKYAARIHHETQINFAPDLAYDVAHSGRKELAEFVLNRRNRFPLKTGIVPGEFLRPKRTDKRVAHLSHNPGAIFVIGEHSVDAEQRGVLRLQQCSDGVAQNVFKSWPPRISPDALECGDEAGSDEGAVPLGDVCQGIEPDREIHVGRIKVNQIVCAPGWKMIQKFIREVTVRVEQRNAIATVEVLQYHITQQGGLT